MLEIDIAAPVAPVHRRQQIGEQWWSGVGPDTYFCSLARHQFLLAGLGAGRQDINLQWQQNEPPHNSTSLLCSSINQLIIIQ